MINITLYPEMDLSQRNKEEVCVMLLSRSLYAIFFKRFVSNNLFYISITPFTPAKHVLLNWFSLNENYKQRTEKLDFPLDSSTS